jgi:hypothetical protein
MSFVRILLTIFILATALPLLAEESMPLPYEPRDLRKPVAQEKTESGTSQEDCGDCDAQRSPMGLMPGMRDLRGIAKKTEAVKYPDLLRQIAETGKCQGTGLNCSRGMVQIPLKGNRGNIGPCGSHHYTPDPPPGTDAYASPIANCAFTAVLQEWKKNHCPDRAGCTVAWGDFSHKTRSNFNGHSDHTNGDCVDLRPLRKGGFVDGGLRWMDNSYDRAKTTELISLMKRMGADVVLFNDTQAGGKKMSGHSNHIHVCFKNSGQSKKTCQDLEVDGNICPELQ